MRPWLWYLNRARAAGLVLGVLSLLPLPAPAQAQSAAPIPAPGTVFRDCPDCPEMVVIPAGSFTMGAAPGEEEAENFSQQERGRSAPQIRIRIAQPFAMGRTHVTRGEFAAFVRESGYTSVDSCTTFERNPHHRWEVRSDRNWRMPGFEQDDQHPVVCVSWDDAQAYVAWLTRKTGKAYRLPGEAEWEYAARAGTTTRRPWGDSADAGCAYANIADRTFNRVLGSDGARCDDGFAYTAPAGTYRANGFGLYDMIGNAWQAMADCWNESLAGQPADGTARTNGDCSDRVVRGGAWIVDRRETRPASRRQNATTQGANHAGFRVARAL